MHNVSATSTGAAALSTGQEPESTQTETPQRPPSTNRQRGTLEALSGEPTRRSGSLEITVAEDVTASGSSAQIGGSRRHGSSSRRTLLEASNLLGPISRALGTSSRRNADPVMNLQLLGGSDALSDSFAARDLEAGIVTPQAPDIPQGPIGSGFPTTIAHWQMAVHQERNRRCDPEAIVGVLNAVRGVGTANVDESHQDAMRRITPEHVAAWRAGIGLTARDVAVIESNSRTVGRFIPSSSTLFNLINYGVVPWLPNMGRKSQEAHDGHPATGLKNPINNALISMGIAGVVQPLVTALVQTPIVAALDTWRKKMGPAVMLDKGVHARLTPAAAGAQVRQASSELRGIQGRVESLFREMAGAYGVEVGDEPLSEEQVGAVVQHLNHDPDGDRQAVFMGRLAEHGRECLDAEGDVRESSDQLRMSTGVQDRQWQSTTHQILPRVARAASSYVTPIGRWIERAHHKDPTPYTTIAAVGAAGVSMVWQHFAAGEDEVEGAANVEEKLNILYGTSYLKPEGIEALRRGGPFEPQHVDEAKLRGLAPGAASQMLDRVIATVNGYQTALSPTNHEHAPKLAEYEHDLRALADNDLQHLTPGGDAEKLMNEVIGRGGDKHPFTFAAREGWNKLTKLEITAQIGQRLGVAWMMGAFGNVGATAGGRMVTALNGGSSHAPLKVQFGASTLSSAFGAVSAVTNYMPVNVKNERRADPDRVSMGRQVLNSVISPLWQGRQSRAARAATSTVGAAVAGATPATAEARNAARQADETGNHDEGGGER